MLPKSSCVLIIVLAACLLGLGMALPGATPADAAPGDVDLFQEVLSKYGQWLNYGQYGQVWRPGQVSQNWRPYTNGRWLPTQEGYVFETDEPWGWATYHYGNWLPTNQYGWVWVPGRTWYPHTVNWRTNEDNVGWAPVPPSEDLVADNYYSEGYPAGEYGQTADLNSYGTPLGYGSPSAWIFTRAADFLQGWGQPYSSAYSYANAEALVAPQYVPTIYERTVFVNNYVFPSYAPHACYNWGPPVNYIARVTKVGNIEADQRYKDLRLARLHNVMPPTDLKNRHPAWRQVWPTAAANREMQIRPVGDNKLAAGRLNRPDAIPVPLSWNRKPAVASSPQGLSAPGSPATRTNQVLATNPEQPAYNRNGLSPQSTNNYATGTQKPRGPHSPRVMISNANASKTVQREFEAASTIPPAPNRTSPTGLKKAEAPLAAPPRQLQPPGGYQRVEPQASQENRFRRNQGQPWQQERQRAEQEMRRRQERLEMESRQRQALACQQAQQQARIQQQQQYQAEIQRRQAEMQRQQQMQQIQQRQQQVQQIQQRRQAEMQRMQQLQQQRQTEMMQARQMQQLQLVRPTAPPPRQAPPPQGQKRRDNQNKH